jgi:hypothetical protein
MKEGLYRENAERQDDSIQAMSPTWDETLESEVRERNELD